MDHSVHEPRDSWESFWYLGLYEYDIDHARALVADGREPVELDEESLHASVEGGWLDEEHLANVDVTIPGIIAHVQYPTDEGEILHGHVLIDGHHRGARCLREQRPYHVYLLTEEESQAILLRGPEDPFPPLRVHPVPDGDDFSVVSPRDGETYSIDAESAFLLEQFDGRKTSAMIREAYHERFGEPLPREQLNALIKWAQARGIVEFTATLRFSKSRR
jgi:hypothetical protein